MDRLKSALHQAVHLARRRPFALIMSTIGLAAFALLFFRGESTRDRIVQLETRVIERGTQPCPNLTARECALKLYRSLPPRIRDRSSLIIRRELRRLVQEGALPPSVAPERVSPSPEPAPPTAPTEPTPPGNNRAPQGQRGPRGPQGPPGDDGQAGEVVNPPLADPDPIGPVDIPPIELPGIPCIELPGVIRC